MLARQSARVAAKSYNKSESLSAQAQATGTIIVIVIEVIIILMLILKVIVIVIVIVIIIIIIIIAEVEAAEAEAEANANWIARRLFNFCFVPIARLWRCLFRSNALLGCNAPHESASLSLEKLASSLAS